MNNAYMAVLFLFLITFSSVTAQIDITNLSGGVVTSQFNDSPINEGVEHLVDNSSLTKYLTFHASSWVVFKVSDPYVVTNYALTSANDAPERDPLSWTLEGSYNGITYFLLDNRTGQDFPNRLQRRNFSIRDHSQAYLYFRLSMQNNTGSILQLAEMELFGTEGSLPTEPIADFSVDSYLVTELPVSFTDGSINAASRKWTFEGGNPATSTEVSPHVVFSLPGDFLITLEAIQGDVSVKKTRTISIRDVNDWSEFVYPEVNLTSVNIANPGYVKYTQLATMKGFNSIEDFVMNCCLVIAKELYYTVDEANEHNLRTINYKLNEGGHLSYKSGSVPTIEIGFDMNYLNSFSQTHGDDVSADEIYGVLCHELCHGYQRSPRNAGAYEAGSEYYAFIEGTADLARLLTGGFNPRRYPQVGGSWIDGYNTTAFFYQWITNTYSSTFLKDLNRTALTMDPWSLNSATMSLLNKSAQSLWNSYQLDIPTLATQNNQKNRITISVNPSKTILTLNNLSVNDTVTIHNISGQVVCQFVSTQIVHHLDILDYPAGVYVVSVGDFLTRKTIKFVK